MKKFFTLLFLLPLFCYSQNYPDIHYSRPRIYIDSTRFSFLQNNLSTGDCGSTYTSFINAVNSNWYNDPQLYLLGNDSTLWTWDFNSQWAQDQGLFVASIFRITLDTLALKRCRFVISKLNQKYDTLNFANYDWYTNENSIRSFSDIGGVMFDWCYDYLPIQMRQNLAQNLYKVERYFMNTYITSGAGNSYVSSHNAWNTVFANQNAIVLDSADELSTLQQDTVKQWYHITFDKFNNGFLPCYGYYRDISGGWNWTAAYSMWSLVDQFQYFENMRIATGKDYYHDLPWVKNSINQYWYFMQPNGWSINWGDGYTNEQGDRVIYRHAQLFNDPRSLWLAQYYSQPANITWTWPIYMKLMYKDFTAPIVTKPDIAHDWFSDKTGLSVSRTGWDPTSTLVWMYNAPTKKSAHEHRDNNSICVYRNAPQIINSGYYYSYGNSHYINYYMKTIAHNSICVFDSTDTYTNWGVNVSNDGGQNESPTLMNYNSIFASNAKKGKWVQWASGTDYCYQISDAEQSYDTAKLDRFRRRVLFYKPDHVIILDHLHLKNITTHQRNAKFILHFQKQPSISGSMVNVKVPNHIETYNGKDVLQANGNGNVAIRTLLPLNSTITRIGGVGYEYYVNGQNYLVGGAVDTINTTPGNWRIETSPTLVTDSLVFFHTIKIGDNLSPAVAGGIGEQNHYTIGTDWDNTLFFFNAIGDTNSTYQVLNSISGNRSVNIFAADMIPSMNYSVLVDNAIVSTVNADTNGVIETQINLSAGIHKVEIGILTSSVTSKTSSIRPIQVFPNPVKNKITVVSDGIESLNFTLFNVEGTIVINQSLRNKVTLIDLSTCSDGIYTYQVMSKSGIVQSGKIIKQ